MSEVSDSKRGAAKAADDGCHRQFFVVAAQLKRRFQPQTGEGKSTVDPTTTYYSRVSRPS